MVGIVLGLAFGVLVLIEVWRRDIVPLEEKVSGERPRSSGGRPGRSGCR